MSVKKVEDKKSLELTDEECSIIFACLMSIGPSLPAHDSKICCDLALKVLKL